jgi:hypothetical protein
MTALEKYIDKIRIGLPEVCSVHDLIKIGFFSSEQQAYYSRKYGNGPECFKLNGRYRYLRDSVIEYLTVGSAE